MRGVIATMRKLIVYYSRFFLTALATVAFGERQQ